MKPQILTTHDPGPKRYKPGVYKQWYAKNSEMKKAKQRTYYAENREDGIAAAKAYRVKNPGCWKASHLKRLYGIDIATVDSMRKAQNNSCAICKVEFNDEVKKLKPHVDHSHATGKVRGLLCQMCNTALGHVERDGFLESALKYLGGT